MAEEEEGTMPNKYFETFAGESVEELHNRIDEYMAKFNGNGNGTPNAATSKEIDDLKTQISTISTRYSSLYSQMTEATTDITQMKDELTHISLDINDLYNDKMNKEFGVVSRLYSFYRTDTPVDVSKPIIPDYQNHITYSALNQIVDLISVDNDAHL